MDPGALWLSARYLHVPCANSARCMQLPNLIGKVHTAFTATRPFGLYRFFGFAFSFLFGMQ